MDGSLCVWFRFLVCALASLRQGQKSKSVARCLATYQPSPFGSSLGGEVSTRPAIFVFFVFSNGLGDVDNFGETNSTASVLPE